MIIDVHAHLGLDHCFDFEQTEAELLEAYDRYKIDKAIVQPSTPRPYLEDTKAVHDRIAAMCGRNPGRIFGMISANPHFRDADYRAEVLRCKNTLGFIGIKIHTFAYSVNPSGIDGMKVFDIAREIGLPVMIHTGNGIPFADPIAAYGAVKSHPEVSTVISHTGGNMLQTQALIMAKEFKNVYLEPSWMPSVCIAAMIKKVGSDKIMFGSDEIGNLKPALDTFADVIGNDEDYENVMWRTAAKVYGIM
ncbi:MAG: amidohydrolase family protein [Treponema sp.]|jgi:predicted TIM-barrel fold metal-dependent hydrolase|nr:amidohydrolase family protein [Treponema sp.]